MAEPLPDQSSSLRAWLTDERDSLQRAADSLKWDGARDFERGRLAAGAYYVGRLLERIPSALDEKEAR